MPYDPAIPLLSIYLDKAIIQKDTCTPRFIAALFTITKMWKQPKCPWTDEWIKKIRDIYIYIYIHIHTHTIEYYSAIKKNEIMPFAAMYMDGPRDYHTKCSKSERERQIPYDITYMWNLKYDTNELIYETERDSQT